MHVHVNRISPTASLEERNREELPMKKRLALLCALMLLVQLVTVPGLLAGAEDITTPSDLTHVHHGTITYDDTECWEICKDCGEEIHRQPHIADCTAPDVCLHCGQTGVTVHVAHLGERELQYNNSECWEICKDCGSETNRTRHYGACDDSTTCQRCKQTGVTLDYIQHSDVWMHDAKTHWYACEVCGDTHFNQKHWAYCDTEANTCKGCGATDVTVAFVDHQEGTNQYDQLYCWWKCNHCGENYNKVKHWGNCSDGGKCTRCGATGVKLDFIDHEWSEELEHNATTHWGSCMQCGEKYEEPHEAYCDAPNTCIYCGGTGVTIEDGLLFHGGCDWEKAEYNDFEHWYTCTECGVKTNAVQHTANCTNPDECMDCGATGVSMDKIWHEEVYDMTRYGYDNDNHWWTCLDCGQKMTEKHSFDDGVMDACNICGAEVEAPAEPTPTAEPTAAPTETPTAAPTAAPTEAPTAEPTAAPTEAPTAAPTAAPTEAPTAEPTAAPTEAPTAEPTAEPTAKPTVVPPMKPAAPTAEPAAEPTHVCVFEAAFVSNGDGTHSKSCQEGCGNTITESCPLMTMDTELMLCKVCPICGYASYSIKENAGALAGIEQAPATVVRVEAAAVAAADEGAEEAMPENAVLIVHEATFDVPVTLPEGVQGTVEKVFTATLIKDEQSIQPSGKVKLSIPVDDETAAAMDGKKLMLLREDGTLLEIEYEIIDGQIVFITEELGVFLLMEGIAAE